MPPETSSKSLEERWQLCRVREQRDWSEDLRSLFIETGARGHLHGQFVRLGMMNGDELVTRPYSLVNVKDDPTSEVLYNLVPEGALTPRLWELATGDEIYVSRENFGTFVLESLPEIGRHLWCCGTGTGIGPYVPMILDESAWQRFDSIVVLHGVRRPHDLAYRSLFGEIGKERGGRFQYHPVVSRDPGFDGLRGRITDLASQGDLEEATGLPISGEDSQFLLCGNDGFIKEMRNILLTKGLKKNLRREPGNITIERYWG